MYNFGLKIKISEFSCLMCGMTPLKKIEGREFWCETCEKRVIISTDYYGSINNAIEELTDDTVLVRTR